MGAGQLEVQLHGWSKTRLHLALLEAGVRLNAAAEQLFADDRFVPSAQAQCLKLRVTTVAALGHAEGATLPQLRQAIAGIGGAEAALEVAPYLRLQDPSLSTMGMSEEAAAAPLRKGTAPIGSLTVLSPPLSADLSVPRGFYLRQHGDEAWLRGYWCDDEHVWAPTDHLLYLLS